MNSIAGQDFHFTFPGQQAQADGLSGNPGLPHPRTLRVQSRQAGLRTQHERFLAAGPITRLDHALLGQRLRRGPHPRIYCGNAGRLELSVDPPFVCSQTNRLERAIQVLPVFLQHFLTQMLKLAFAFRSDHQNRIAVAHEAQPGIVPRTLGIPTLHPFWQVECEPFLDQGINLHRIRQTREVHEGRLQHLLPLPQQVRGRRVALKAPTANVLENKNLHAHVPRHSRA